LADSLISDIVTTTLLSDSFDFTHRNPAVILGCPDGFDQSITVPSSDGLGMNSNQLRSIRDGEERVDVHALTFNISSYHTFKI